jgi:hypothetical protein
VVGTFDLPRGFMAVVGHHAYVISRKTLCVMDISNPKAPKEVGSCVVPDYYGMAMAVAGNHAYVACRQRSEDGGLFIVDVSDPKAPKHVGFCDLPDTEPNSVAVAGNHVYIADSEGASGAIVVLDVSDPLAPRKVSKYGGWMTGGLAAKGNYVYLACGALEVLDISNPLALKSVEAYEDTKEFSAWNVVVSGDYVYVSGHAEAGLSIFRITTPSDKDGTHTKGG